jgi:hypothetical protein
VPCPSGVGDRLFDAIAGVVASQLGRGCKRPTVRLSDRYAFRSYDWDGLLSSPEFILEGSAGSRSTSRQLSLAKRMPRRDAAVGVPAKEALKTETALGGRAPLRVEGVGWQCGRHGIESWLRGAVNAERLRTAAAGGGSLEWRATSVAELRAHLLHVARSIRLTACAPPHDIHERVAIHVRRTDKLNSVWQEEGYEERVYEGVRRWFATSREKKAYLATDDALFGQTFEAQLLAQGVDVEHATPHTPGGGVAADLCAMSRSKLIVKAGASSQFSSLAAALGRVPLLSFANRLGQQMDAAHAYDGLLLNLTFLTPPRAHGHSFFKDVKLDRGLVMSAFRPSAPAMLVCLLLTYVASAMAFRRVGK